MARKYFRFMLGSKEELKNIPYFWTSDFNTYYISLERVLAIGLTKCPAAHTHLSPDELSNFVSLATDFKADRSICFEYFPQIMNNFEKFVNQGRLELYQSFRPNHDFIVYDKFNLDNLILLLGRYLAMFGLSQLDYFASLIYELHGGKVSYFYAFDLATKSISLYLKTQQHQKPQPVNLKQAQERIASLMTYSPLIMRSKQNQHQATGQFKSPDIEVNLKPALAPSKPTNLMQVQSKIASLMANSPLIKRSLANK